MKKQVSLSYYIVLLSCESYLTVLSSVFCYKPKWLQNCSLSESCDSFLLIVKIDNYVFWWAVLIPGINKWLKSLWLRLDEIPVDCIRHHVWLFHKLSWPIIGTDRIYNYLQTVYVLFLYLCSLYAIRYVSVLWFNSTFFRNESVYLHLWWKSKGVCQFLVFRGWAVKEKTSFLLYIL